MDASLRQFISNFLILFLIQTSLQISKICLYFAYAVHFHSLINAEAADTRTMAVSRSIPKFDLL